MGEDQVQETKYKNAEKTNKVEDKLPPCTMAPSAEQARAYDDGEPCDDGREGETDQV